MVSRVFPKDSKEAKTVLWEGIWISQHTEMKGSIKEITDTQGPIPTHFLINICSEYACTVLPEAMKQKGVISWKKKRRKKQQLLWLEKPDPTYKAKKL